MSNFERPGDESLSDHLKEPEFTSKSFSEFSKTSKSAAEIAAALHVDANQKEDNDGGMYKFAGFQNFVQDPYPSPFLNLSDTKIPDRMTELFGLCKYFYTFDPLVSGAINSLAHFPVTDVILEESRREQARRADNKDASSDESKQLRVYRKAIIDNVGVNKLLIEIGIDYWLYGNCFVFGEFWTNPDTKETEWKHVVRLDPRRIIIDYNESTRSATYKWVPGKRLSEVVKNKRPRNEYDKIPEYVKKAVLNNESLVINPNNIYHFSRASDSSGDTIWGIPVIANVMKLLMYRNVLRQAQEAIAREHIVPFRVYYFDKTATYDTQVDWSNVTSSFASELNKSSRDPNYKVISPLPVNVLNLGGDGRSLLLTPEIEQVQAEILAGMNLPREFIFGGVSWSGSSISLKIVENGFITYRLLLKDFLHFLIKNMAKARNEWTSEDDNDNLPVVRLQDLKMQDDSQQKQTVINLNSANKVSNRYMWKVLGIDSDKMEDEIEAELMRQSEMQARVQAQAARMQALVQVAQLDAQVEFLVYQEKLKRELLESNDPIKQAVAQQLFGGAMIDPSLGSPVPGMAGPIAAGQPISEAPSAIAAGGPDAMDAADPTDQANLGNQPDASDQLKALAEQLISLPEKDRDGAIAKLRLPATMQQQLKQLVGAAQADSFQGRGYAQAQALAEQYLQIPEQDRDEQIKLLPKPLQQKVRTIMEQMEPPKKPQKNKPEEQDGIDMRPMPEQRPPRRNSLG